MEIQSFTPLFEVLCGFNVAFALWDGLGNRIVAYAVSRLNVDSRINHLRAKAVMVEALLRDAYIVAFVNNSTGRMSRTIGEIAPRIEQTANIWRRVSGLILAALIMWIIAFAGLHPDYELPWASWPVVAAFILVSLASVWGAVVGAVLIWHKHVRELKGIEMEVKEKFGKVQFF